MTTTATTNTRVTGDVPRRTRRIGLAAWAAAGLSFVAAVIHLKVVPEHLEHWWVYGAFFLVCAVAQALTAVLILCYPSSRSISLVSIAGNVAIVAIYVVSRTWGMPLGPDWRLFSPGVAHVEDPEMLAIVATAAEVGVIIACAALLQGAYRRWAFNALLFVGVLLWGSRLVGMLP